VKSLSGHLPEVNEAQGKRWKTREKFHSGLEDEAAGSWDEGRFQVVLLDLGPWIAL
jgi:hypothetical protein